VKIKAPAFEKLSEYYKTYWKFIGQEDMFEALKKQAELTEEFLENIPPGLADFRYAEGKWKVKEVAGHISDAERILAYRALRFARNDHTPLPGFDENAFMQNSSFDSRTLENIIEEWKSVRNATITLFESMSEKELDRKGTANNTDVTPRILLYFILVHERHHLDIIRERYLTAFKA
jgi:uncharacterized damage-inducible protein DinB